MLDHPNIVSVHEVGLDDETLFIVSDLIRGVTDDARPVWRDRRPDQIGSRRNLRLVPLPIDPDGLDRGEKARGQDQCALLRYGERGDPLCNHRRRAAFQPAVVPDLDREQRPLLGD